MLDCPQDTPPLVCLEDWYSSPLGRNLAACEEECLERMLRDTFGYYLLQVGLGTGFREAIGTSRIRHRILVPTAARPQTLGVQVVAAPDRLPVAADSVDVVFLPHTLDFATDPRQVLREAERVLIPEGRVILMGFNAWSLWGWRPISVRRGRVPWRGSFLTPFRVVDWLSLLGFDVEVQEMAMFRPPWRRALAQQWSFLDSLGRRFWPLLGAVYAIRAVKRVSTLTAVRPAWPSRTPVLQGGAIEPTTRDNGRA